VSLTCCSRTLVNKYGSEAAHALHSAGRQQDDEYLSQRQNPMMMTMKKPMNASSRRQASPPARSVSRRSAPQFLHSVSIAASYADARLSYGKGDRPHPSITPCCPIKMTKARISKSSLAKDSTFMICKAFLEIPRE